MKNNRITKKVLKALREALKCYAGRMHLTRGGNKGYALLFEKVTEFPGRMEAIARASDLTGKARPDKPWISGASRIIFVSDMGDALSKGVSFEYLRKEIIDPVTSPEGSNHIWTWLTKRPARMAAFSRWLMAQGIKWPDNLIAMTSVTSKRTCGRIDALKMVAAPYKGLSVEPLWESIDVDLTGIDWCIVGGER